MLSVTASAPERCDFVLKDCGVSTANAIRRACHAYVRTLAFHTAEIESNEGAYENELLAHRLGLLVLRGTTPGWATIDVTCDQANMNVTARHVTWPDGVSPAHPDTVLTTLQRGQRLCLRANIEWGCGSDHAKWNPCSTVSMDKREDGVHMGIRSCGQYNAIDVARRATECIIERLSNIN